MDLKDAYIQELPKWFEAGLKPFVKASETRIQSATDVLAIGGGSMLPGVKNLLAKKGITVPDEPRWLNAKGLYMVALRNAP